MILRVIAIFCVSSFAWFLSAASLGAMESGAGLAGKRSGLENQRIEQKMWSPGAGSSLMEKKFPIEEWGKHFSPVGSKRSPISTENSRERKIFETSTKEFPVKEFEMSRWDERLAELQETAGIRTDDAAQKFADAQLYDAMLQDTRKYADLAEELSLRDINRYQFRRNRSDGEIPIEKAGQGGTE